MKYYVLDDDINVVKMLSSIIENDFSRSVIGSNCNPIEAVHEIKRLKPDIVIVDYLMPHLDGAEVINDIVVTIPSIQFVMISQVSDKEMIADAYKAGISFFISKPINKIEIESVLKHVESEISNKQMLKKIMTALDFSKLDKDDVVDLNGKIKISLRDLGLLGEKSAQDILEICSLKLRDESLSFSEVIIEYSKQKKETPKAIKQRVRRSVQNGLTNLAYIGIEDYMNEIFLRYSNSVYSFQSVKNEMDYIRGRQMEKGKCNLYKFLESLIHTNQI